MKSISDDLSLADNSISEDDLVLHVLRGVNSKYKPLTTTIKARPIPFFFFRNFMIY